MRTGLSSKHSKKNSDEERSKKKRMRSSKRRRHDSSSSSSYSSGSEIDPRSRKKRNQRDPKKPEKMRKESRKPVKKKSRKIRHRGDASVSYSSRSCSTCRGRSSSSGGSENNSGRSRSRARGNKRVKLRERTRSRSPPRADRKPKLRGRSRSSSAAARADGRVKSREGCRSKDGERGRSRRSLRRMSSKRDGGRYLSRSCSSCSRSGGRSSQSYSQSLGYSEGKGKEVDRPKRLKSSLVVTKESEEMERSGSRRYSESQSHSEGKGKEVDQPRRLKSALVVTKESEEMEGIRARDKIIRGYDDLGKSFDAYEQALDGRQVELGGEEHATDTWVGDMADVKGDKYVLTKLNTEPAKNADFGSYDSTRKNNGDAVNAGSSEPEDLELLLRQKALENFRKFRGGFLAQKGTSDDQKDESVQIEPCKDAGRFVEAKDTISSSNCKSTSSLERQGSVQGGVPMTQPRIRSIVNIPTDNGDASSFISCLNASESSRPGVDPIVMSATDGQTTPNHLKRKEDPSDKVSSGKTLLAKDIQNVKAVAEPGSSATIADELEIADGSVSGASACLNVKNGNKPAEEYTTGSHFEQKTFSRMHDGEMVQVSYKVYIPKKSPALARRQLQR